VVEFSDYTDEALGFHNNRYLNQLDAVIRSRKTLLCYGTGDVLHIGNSEILKLIFVITGELQLKC
jgi:hypothetical protein